MKASELIFIHAEGGVDADLKCNACQKELSVGTSLRYADVEVSKNQTATVIVCSRTCQRFFVRKGDQWLNDFLTELRAGADTPDTDERIKAAINEVKTALENVEIHGVKLKLGNP